MKKKVKLLDVVVITRAVEGFFGEIGVVDKIYSDFERAPWPVSRVRPYSVTTATYGGIILSEDDFEVIGTLGKSRPYLSVDESIDAEIEAYFSKRPLKMKKILINKLKALM